jgi:UDP-N-acetyl-D-mannosaminuronic acid dehydrogenase
MAEMCKLTENSYRDVSIAFANELSMICGELDLDVWELIALANRHPRVNILQPGPGVGGHCIAVDPWFIIAAAPEQAKLIRTAREVNESKKDWVIDQLLAMAEKRGKKQTTVACLGLTFKPDIDDLRESPALEIALALASRPGFTVIAHEPHIDELPINASAIKLMPLDTCLSSADLVLLLVDHTEYKQRDWTGLSRPVLDTRGIMASYRKEEKAAA